MNGKRWVVLGPVGNGQDGRWGFLGTANEQTPAGAVADVGLRSGRNFHEWPHFVAFCPDDLRRSD
ncbi:MAG: hypothetical protein QOG77_2205, partial [Solirubrobacteraceae bacterium]|jgi:hypothetical protein|nr:hypothetical protein [Solirubrobacteraceae bacterium]